MGCLGDAAARGRGRGRGVAISAQEQALRQSSAQAADDFDLLIGARQPHAARVDERLPAAEALALIDGAILNALAATGAYGRQLRLPSAIQCSAIRWSARRRRSRDDGPPCAERRPALCPRGRSGRRCDVRCGSAKQ